MNQTSNLEINKKRLNVRYLVSSQVISMIKHCTSQFPCLALGIKGTAWIIALAVLLEKAFNLCIGLNS